MKKDIKKLYRSKKNRMLFGVCAGIADYFELDPTLVRLLYVGITLVSAVIPGIILYIIAVIIIPEEN